MNLERKIQIINDWKRKRRNRQIGNSLKLLGLSTFFLLSMYSLQDRPKPYQYQPRRDYKVKQDGIHTDTSKYDTIYGGRNKYLNSW